MISNIHNCTNPSVRNWAKRGVLLEPSSSTPHHVQLYTLLSNIHLSLLYQNSCKKSPSTAKTKKFYVRPSSMHIILIPPPTVQQTHQMTLILSRLVKKVRMISNIHNCTNPSVCNRAKNTGNLSQHHPPHQDAMQLHHHLIHGT